MRSVVLNFLHRRGFGRIEMAGRQYALCHIIDKIVHIVEAYQVSDYIMEFSKAILATNNKEVMVEVMDMLYSGNKGPIPRAELYNGFLEKTPTQRKFMTPHRFKKKMTSWCEYHQAKFNPQVVDKFGRSSGDDKRGGVEYFTIANDSYSN